MNGFLEWMKTKSILHPRREFLRDATIAAGFFAIPGAFADQLTKTPRQTPGPFYPAQLPLDTDNDLLVLNDSLTPAVGKVTHLTGSVLDERGNPLGNTVVEIWQVDANGVYLHPRGGDRSKLDKNFQGYGRFLTSSKGEYYFRTIKPEAYPGRPAPHIHVAVKTKGRNKFTTQCYIKGDPRNGRDFIYKSIRDPKVRASVDVDFKPLPGSKAGELAANFDVVLGYTPED